MRTERVDVSTLTPYPGNPRRGNVSVIASSLATLGQYRPIVVQSATRYVLAGNHTLAAATMLGWDSIDVAWVDCDDATARRIVAADNRTSDLGGYDTEELLALLDDLPNLDGTGYEDDEVERLRTLIAEPLPAPATPGGVPAGSPEDEWVGLPDYEQPDRQSAFRCIVHFATEADADLFFDRLGTERRASLWWPEHDGLVGSNVHEVYVAER